MSKTPTRSTFAVLILGVVTLIPSSLLAQAPALTLSGGRAPYDLAGTGTAVVFTARVDVNVTRVLVLESGIGFLRHEEFGAHHSYLLPEVSAQLQVPGRIVRPYFGAGTGYATMLEGGDISERTLHAALGVRIELPSGWILRPEGRLRGFGPFNGSSTDITLGVGHRF